jgi:hypothetical protein
MESARREGLKVMLDGDPASEILIYSPEYKAETTSWWYIDQGRGGQTTFGIYPARTLDNGVEEPLDVPLGSNVIDANGDGLHDLYYFAWAQRHMSIMLALGRGNGRFERPREVFSLDADPVLAFMFGTGIDAWLAHRMPAHTLLGSRTCP